MAKRLSSRHRSSIVVHIVGVMRLSICLRVVCGVLRVLV